MIDGLSISCVRPIKVTNPTFRDKKKLALVRAVGPSHSRWRDYVENFYIEVPCGTCYLCRKRRANSWRVRLLEELNDTSNFVYNGSTRKRCLFTTFTFRDDVLPSDRRDDIAVYLRKWRDLWRKKFGKSPRYFCTTDKGSQYGRLHLHLLIFEPYNYNLNRYIDIEELKLLDCMWRFGFVDRDTDWIRSSRGVTYVTGYVSGANLEKDAIKHGKPICKEALQYVPYIFVSNGLGKGYVERARHLFKTGEDMYYFYNGFKYALPTYYRNKFYDDETRWHLNLIRKYEQIEYFNMVDTPIYSFLRSKVTLDDAEHLYFNTIARYDKEPYFGVGKPRPIPPLSYLSYGENLESYFVTHKGYIKPVVSPFEYTYIDYGNFDVLIPKNIEFYE